MMSLMGSLFGAMDVVRGAKLVHPVAEPLPAGAAENEPLLAGDAFTPGDNYFGVRLAGLHLVDARVFTTDLLPLCVCLSEFWHAGEQRGVPFSIGPDVIRQRLKNAGVGPDASAAWVELRDLTVIPPTPVSAGNLSLYTGLYSVPGDDLTKSLLSMVGQLGQSIGVGGAALSPALKVAETVYSGFGMLLGIDKVRQVVAALNGNLLTRSGYYLLASAPKAEIKVDELKVRNGRLYRGATAVSEFNYCLFALECHETVVDAVGMAPELFYKEWKTVIDTLASDAGAAPAKLQQLLAAIMTSPNLVEADKDVLMAAYLALYQKRAKVLDAAKQAALTRGGGSGDLVMAAAKQSLVLRRKNEVEAATRLDQVIAGMKAQPFEPTADTEDEVVATARRVRAQLVAKPRPGVAAALLRSTFETA